MPTPECAIDTNTVVYFRSKKKLVFQRRVADALEGLSIGELRELLTEVERYLVAHGACE